MKTLLISLLALAVIVTGFNIRGMFVPGSVKADSITDNKYDGDCTGHETVGRCADKCPGPTSEGVYYQQGIDKDTGAAVCGFSYYHQCPYTDAVSADNPLCYKNQPPAVDPTSAPAIQQELDQTQFVGK